jgi:hypothetical protein
MINIPQTQKTLTAGSPFLTVATKKTLNFYAESLSTKRQNYLSFTTAAADPNKSVGCAFFQTSSQPHGSRFGRRAYPPLLRHSRVHNLALSQATGSSRRGGLLHALGSDRGRGWRRRV